MSSTSKEGLLALTGSFLGLSVISLGLRLYIRKQERQRMFIDDWFAVLGVLCFIGSCIVVFIFVHDKILGYSSSDFTKEQVLAIAWPSDDLGISFDFTNTTTLAAIKLSALFLYQRIFVTGAHPRGFFKAYVLGFAIIVVCWWITFMFLAAFQCPGHFYAPQKGELQYCTLNTPWALGLAVSDFLLDLMVLLLPIPRIWQLKASIVKKLSIIGVFALAFVGLGASIARLVFYVRDINGFFASSDFERVYTQIIYVQMLEAGFSITAINFPCLWGLLTTRLSEQIMHSLRSLRSLTSNDSIQTRANRANSVPDEAKPRFPTGDKSSTAELARDVDAESDSSQQQAPPFRNDLEGQAFVAYAAHDPENELVQPELAYLSTSIRVDRSLEVKHE